MTIHGEPVADTARDGQFKVVYSYPEARALLHLSNCDREINERAYVYKQKEATDEKENKSAGSNEKSKSSLTERQKEMAGAKTGFRQAQADQTWEARRGDRPIFWRF